jgi:putative CocE/NonD family hydrolase
MHPDVTRQQPAAEVTQGGPLPRHVRLLVRMARRQLPAPVCGVSVERGIAVPASDGITLLTDHYRPLAAAPHPTLLVRTPYGRGFPWDYLYGALLGEQGFHVVIQSCRGTGGSQGAFEPFVAEAADAQATIAWLRRQEWFNGSLATIGPSYLGFTQWALATDPPPELRAMVVQVSSDDFYGFLYPGGAFALEATLTGVAAMLSMHRGFGAFTLATLRLLRRYRRVARTLPLIDAYPPAFGGRVGYFEDWITHPEPDDPYWVPRRATVPPELIPPTSLLTGWSDVCLDQTLGLYRRMRDAGREARLVVGPWTHTSGFNKDLPVLFGEALGWLHRHLNGNDADAASLPVRVHVGEPGAPGTWRDLADWPPPGFAERAWYLHGDGTLATAAPAAGTLSSFRYDPADPTPSVGGPRMDSRDAGPQHNNALESRQDVLVFTSEPLTEPLDVIGPVSFRVRARGSTPHFDVFARLCDVDPKGTSWNICDGLLRLGGEPGSGAGGAGADGGWRDVTVAMSATAHRFGAGHRLRVQVSGGAHPRFVRNTGTGEPLATATRLVPVEIEISDGRVLVPTGNSATEPLLTL